MRSFASIPFFRRICFLATVVLLFAFSAVAEENVNCQLYITEAQSNNDAEWSFGFHDYIEVYNGGDTPVILSHYFLSRSADDPFACHLPAVELVPGAPVQGIF